jgi:hypothetical protein
LPRGRSQKPRVDYVRGVGCGCLGGSAAGGGWFVGVLRFGRRGVLGSVGAIGVLESGVRGRGAGGSTLRIGSVVTGAVWTTWGVCRGTLRAGAPAVGVGARAMVVGLFCFALFVGFRVTVVHVAGVWSAGVVSAVGSHGGGAVPRGRCEFDSGRGISGRVPRVRLWKL